MGVIPFVVFLSLLVSAEALASGTAAPQEEASLPEYQRSKLWEIGRPADFYTLGFIRDEKLCATILNALNEPYEWPKDIKIGAYLGWQKTLLHTKYSVDWAEYSKAQSPLSRTIVDIDNDGTLDAVYRITEGIKGIRFAYLLATEKLPDETEDSLSQERLKEIRGPYIEVGQHLGFNLGSILMMREAIDYGSYPAPQDSSMARLGQFKDIIIVGGKAYILAGGTYEQYISGHPMSLRIYQSSGYQKHKFLCEIKQRYQW